MQPNIDSTVTDMQKSPFSAPDASTRVYGYAPPTGDVVHGMTIIKGPDGGFPMARVDDFPNHFEQSSKRVEVARASLLIRLGGAVTRLARIVTLAPAKVRGLT